MKTIHTFKVILDEKVGILTIYTGPQDHLKIVGSMPINHYLTRCFRGLANGTGIPDVV